MSTKYMGNKKDESMSYEQFVDYLTTNSDMGENPNMKISNDKKGLSLQLIDTMSGITIDSLPLIVENKNSGYLVTIERRGENSKRNKFYLKNNSNSSHNLNVLSQMYDSFLNIDNENLIHPELSTTMGYLANIFDYSAIYGEGGSIFYSVQTSGNNSCVLKAQGNYLSTFRDGNERVVFNLNANNWKNLRQLEKRLRIEGEIVTRESFLDIA